MLNCPFKPYLTRRQTSIIISYNKICSQIVIRKGVEKMPFINPKRLYNPSFKYGLLEDY